MSIAVYLKQWLVIDKELQNVLWIPNDHYKLLRSITATVVTRIGEDQERITIVRGPQEIIWCRSIHGVFLVKPGNEEVLSGSLSTNLINALFTSVATIPSGSHVFHRVPEALIQALPQRCTIRYVAAYCDETRLARGFLRTEPVHAALRRYLAGCYMDVPHLALVQLNRPIVLWLPEEQESIIVRLTGVSDANGDFTFGRVDEVYQTAYPDDAIIEPDVSRPDLIRHLCRSEMHADAMSVVWTATYMQVKSGWVEVDADDVHAAVRKHLHASKFLKGGGVTKWSQLLPVFGDHQIEFEACIENSDPLTIYRIDSDTTFDIQLKATAANVSYTSKHLIPLPLERVEFAVHMAKKGDGFEFFTPARERLLRERLGELLDGKALTPSQLDDVEGYRLVVSDIFPRLGLEKHKLYHPGPAMVVVRDKTQIKFIQVVPPLLRVATDEPMFTQQVVCELSVKPSQQNNARSNFGSHSDLTFDTFFKRFSELLQRDSLSANGSEGDVEETSSRDGVLTVDEADLQKPLEGQVLWPGKQVTLLIQKQDVTLTVQSVGLPTDGVGLVPYAIWEKGEVQWDWRLATHTYIKILAPHQVPLLERPLSDVPFWEQKLKLAGMMPVLERVFRKFASMRHPARMSLLKKNGLYPERGLLLEGLPGTGKTKLARSLASLLGAKSHNVILCNGPEMLSKWQGSSEKKVRGLFAAARKDALLSSNPPLHVIIMDEIEGVFPKRGERSGDNGTKDNLVNALLCELQGLNEINNIIFVGITNRKDMLDPALLRPGRIGWHERIDLPDIDARKSILRLYGLPWLSTTDSADGGAILDQIAECMQGLSGADIEAFVLRCVEEMWAQDPVAVTCPSSLFEELWARRL